MTTAYIGFSFSKNISSLMAFKLLQGIGNSFGNECCFAIVADALPRDKFSTGIGCFSIAQAVYQAIVPTVGLRLVVISYVNQFGLVQAASYSIGDKIIQLTNVASQSTRQALASMVAQDLGARNHDRVKQIVRSSLFITLGFASMLALASILFPNFIFNLFSSDDAVLEYSKEIMSIAAITYILAAASSGFDTVTSGSGLAKLGFTAALIDGVILRLSFGFILGIHMHMEAVGFFLGHSLAGLSPVFIHAFYYFSGLWKKEDCSSAHDFIVSSMVLFCQLFKNWYERSYLWTLSL